MSTGGGLPYQLRPNKAIERLIFVDLLSRLDETLSIGQHYEYIGFGGPQMEDFRLVHEKFPAMPMISIEMDPEVFKRQKFNGPHTKVKCRQVSSGEFIESFNPRKKSIIWLDYVEPRKRTEQIAEFQEVLLKVKESSIVKITLNAAAASLGGGQNGPALQARRRDIFLNDFGRCFPNGLEEEAVTTARFPSTLQQVVEYAAIEILQSRTDWRFQPLNSAEYADGQTMLTVTGIVCHRNTAARIQRTPKLIKWEHHRLFWESPVKIEVPELTLKERIYVNQLLPRYENNIAGIQRKIGFLFGDDEAESERKLRNYVSFYRHYPHFGKISI